MNARGLAVAALAAVAVVVAALLVTGDDDGYRVLVPVPNASGLRDGSAVKIGGLDRGKVHLDIDDRDRVVLELDLDESVGKIGKDAKVAIVAANFLGIKRVELTPGNPATNPAPDGYTLPASRLTTPTDLDQVLGVFDADTRTRAKILLNEAGEAVVGRKVDVARLLKELPVGMEQAGPALQQLATDDATMTNLVTRSDRFVAEVTAERRSLTRLVDTLGQTSTTVTARRAELRRTLASAPRTLRTLRGFLNDLRATTRDLGPAAKQITAAAAPLGDTLAEVDDVRRAAAPTLRTATRAAPSLTKLGTQATPVLRELRPTLQSGATLARAMPPVSTALDNSADNVIAILENWSRAIQFRDQMGHVFRGEASFSPDLILTMVNRLTSGAPKSKQTPAKTKRAPAAAPAPAPAPKAEKPAAKLPLPAPVKKVLDALGLSPAVEQVEKVLDNTQGLLDYLLTP